MMYRILCSNGYEPYTFFADNSDEAQMLYRMAINSGMYTYVSLGYLTSSYIKEEEWVGDTE